MPFVQAMTSLEQRTHGTWQVSDGAPFQELDLTRAGDLVRLASPALQEDSPLPELVPVIHSDAGWASRGVC